MARPEKTGLEYYPFDVAFKEHPKVKMVIAEFGSLGYIITNELLCYIYGHKGYYMVWDSQTKLLFANSVAWCGASVNLCQLVVNFLVKWEFFDTSLFDSEKVLTNRRCQKTYLEAARKRKNADIKPEYNLINPFIPQKPEFPAEETPEKTEETTQSKGNEIKGKFLKKAAEPEFPAEETLGFAHWKLIAKQSYADCNEEFRKMYNEFTFVSYQKFNKWLDDEFPFIRERTPQQITIHDFKRLQKKFTTEVIVAGIKSVASSQLNADHNLYARLVHFIENPLGSKKQENEVPKTVAKKNIAESNFAN